MAIKVKLVITNESSDLRAPKKLLAEITKGALRKFSGKINSLSGQYKLSVVLGNSALLKRINRQFRGKNKTTDVISVALWQAALSSEKENNYLGEIYINYQLAQAQAKKMQHSFGQEIALLFIHGLLHILGQDHEKSAKDSQKMRLVEQELISTQRQLNGLLGVIERA